MDDDYKGFNPNLAERQEVDEMKEWGFNHYQPRVCPLCWTRHQQSRPMRRVESWNFKQKQYYDECEYCGFSEGHKYD